jgi:hypothetical protein
LDRSAGRAGTASRRRAKETSMLRIGAALILALSLAGCDAVNTMTEGFSHAKAVEKSLEGAVGVKPNVGFNWSNGRLVQVTVTFPRLIESKPLNDLASVIRESVGREFKQTPENIVLAFAIPK